MDSRDGMRSDVAKMMFSIAGGEGDELLAGLSCALGGTLAHNIILFLDHLRENFKLVVSHIEHPVEVAAHLALHVVDLTKGKHALGDNAPRLVRVRVVANDLASDHEGGDE